MRSALVIVLIALCVAFVAAQTHFSLQDLHRTDTEQLFQEWQEFHSKSYSSAEEAELRYFNFLGQLQRSKDLNAKHNTTNYGITKFSDMSHEEFLAKMLMNPAKIEMPVSPFPDFVKNNYGMSISTYPSDNSGESPAPNDLKPNTRYDWNGNDIVTGPYNQKQCGSCWAWSSMEQLESDWAQQHNLKASELTSKQTYPLSAQQLVDCDTASNGCGGGSTGSAYNYIIKAEGLETEVHYPYTAQNGQCNSNYARAATIKSWGKVGDGDDHGLYEALTKGPVSILVDASKWDSYNGGVVKASECGQSIDHAVQLTGYQTNADAKVSGWWVRNSWGANWGVNGYIQLEYGTNTCNINSYPTQVNTV